jgi:hypothetical protein
MTNKSYNEIIESCELIDYIVLNDGNHAQERWTDGEAIYTCVWLPNSSSFLPTTIYKEYL